MSFFVYDIIFLVIFCVFVFVFLMTRKKGLKREGIIYLYKTKIGIRAIDYIGKRYAKLLEKLKYVVIGFGWLSMAVMIYLIAKLVFVFFKFPEFIRAVKIPPIAPIIPYLPQIFKADYLPMLYFTYWIVVLAIVAIIHEFLHGIFAKAGNIRIKSTGFYFMGPFTGAFVEQDEKQMLKAKKKDQMAMLAAGSFANGVATVFFLILLILFFKLSFAASGVMFNTYAYTVINKSEITFIGNNITINFDGGLNLIEIAARNKTYYMPREIGGKIENQTKILAYDNTPALKAGLNGAIVEINNVKTRNDNELRREILKYKPGDKIAIKTFDTKEKKQKEYEIELSENPNNKSTPYIGIATILAESGILGKIRMKVTFFKDPNIYYSAKFAPEFAEFVYYLIWWLVLINFSVALANMLPVGIFDGGRFFYLGIWAIFGREKLAKKLFKLSTYLILGVFAILMILWAFAFF